MRAHARGARGHGVVGVREPEIKEVNGINTAVDAAFADAAQYTVIVDESFALDAMLNQSNFEAGANTNKFYKFQALKDVANDSYALWTRWGRVGELVRTNTQLKSCPTKEAAIALFHRTFKSIVRPRPRKRATADPWTSRAPSTSTASTQQEEGHGQEARASRAGPAHRACFVVKGAQSAGGAPAAGHEPQARDREGAMGCAPGTPVLLVLEAGAAARSASPSSSRSARTS